MGFLAALVSALCGFSKDLCSKKVAASMHSSTSTFASFLFALPFYVLVLLYLVLTGRDVGAVTGIFLGFVLLRAVTDIGAEWFKMKAFSVGDLSTVTMTVALTPIFLVFTSPIITGDPLTLRGVLALALSVAGSMVLIDFRSIDTKTGQGQAIVFGLASAFFFSLNTCFDRLAVQEGSATLAGFGMTIASAVLLAPLVIGYPIRRTEMHEGWKPLLLRGVFETSFMVSKLYALTLLQAPYVLSIQRLSLVFSIIGGRILFAEQNVSRRLVACVLILAGSLVIVLE